NAGEDSTSCSWDCGECEEGATRQCGTTDAGECAYGTQACTAGSWEECIGATSPTAETCTGSLDEDCDSLIDCTDTDCTTNLACTTECIDSTKLVDYISQWKQGNITLAALMQKMKQWKAGTGC
ncbi:MAG: hypothetical protein Q8N60_03330, partial [Candidatus Diapherotrites archaeon]|nr:hypothetical protein [Candidatus Diapherotrites archaeon]